MYWGIEGIKENSNRLNKNLFQVSLFFMLESVDYSLRNRHNNNTQLKRAQERIATGKSSNGVCFRYFWFRHTVTFTVCILYIFCIDIFSFMLLWTSWSRFSNDGRKCASNWKCKFNVQKDFNLRIDLFAYTLNLPNVTFYVACFFLLSYGASSTSSSNHTLVFRFLINEAKCFERLLRWKWLQTDIYCIIAWNHESKSNIPNLLDILKKRILHRGVGQKFNQLSVKSDDLIRRKKHFLQTFYNSQNGLINLK